MSVSPWRLLHLWLALVTAVFLLIASVTGVILAFEPVYEQSFGYQKKDADQLTIAQLLENTSDYSDISSLEKDHNGYFLITIFDDAGENTFYIDPFNGERLGDPIKTPEVFDVARNLHRSLYLKQTGRFLIGTTSVLLIFISIAGFVLVVKKQGGIRYYFRRVIRDNFYQDYHTLMGKWLIWLILFVSITGSILFLERFGLIEDQVVDHNGNIERNDQAPSIDNVFEIVQLEQFKELVFPFSDFDDDFFELKLTDKELLIRQKTFNIVSQVAYTQETLLSNFSFKWHTGEGQTWWAILLGISSAGMLFFIYSGFAIYIKRTSSRSKWQNSAPKEQCEVVIAVGSETGATADKAAALQLRMTKAGLHVYLVTLNDFEYYPALKHLILMTSTYGKGDAPSNASQFVKKFNSVKEQYHTISFAVVGFGSRAYPDFCQYAVELDQLMDQQPRSSRLLPLHKVEDGSHSFEAWAKELSSQLNLDLQIEDLLAKQKTVQLQVLNNQASTNRADETFILELSANKKNLKDIQSGDLLAITPEDRIPRYYSMSVTKNSILLSIKRMQEGVVSGQLASLSVGDLIEASFKKNPSFHFPKKSPKVLLIANGTGIAPFLGMLDANTGRIPVTLFWGGQNETSLELYESRLNEYKRQGKLEVFHCAFSRVDQGARYVQQLVKENEKIVVDSLNCEGTIMICGSLNMQEEVEKVLHGMAEKHLNKSIGYFKEKHLLLSDCY